jgi:hypothetical protein
MFKPLHRGAAPATLEGLLGCACRGSLLQLRRAGVWALQHAEEVRVRFEPRLFRLFFQ